MKKLSILSLLLAGIAIQPLGMTTIYPMDPEDEENPFVSTEENDSDDEKDALNTTLTFLLGTQASKLKGETKKNAITAILESQKSFSQLIEYAQQETTLAQQLSKTKDGLSKLKYNLVALFTDAKPKLPQLPKKTDTTATDEQLDYLILQLATGTKLPKETRDWIKNNQKTILKRLNAPKNSPTQKAPLLEFFSNRTSRALIINNKIILDDQFWTGEDFSKDPKFLINPQTKEYEVRGVTVVGTKSIEEITEDATLFLQKPIFEVDIIACLQILKSGTIVERSFWEPWAWLNQEKINEFAQTKLLTQNSPLIFYLVQQPYFNSISIFRPELIKVLKEYTNYTDQKNQEEKYEEYGGNHTKGSDQEDQEDQEEKQDEPGKNRMNNFDPKNQEDDNEEYEENDDEEESTETKSLVTRAFEHPYITAGSLVLGITACYGIYRYFTKTSSAKGLLQSNGLKATTKQVVPTQPHASSVKK